MLQLPSRDGSTAGDSKGRHHEKGLPRVEPGSAGAIL